MFSMIIFGCLFRLVYWWRSLVMLNDYKKYASYNYVRLYHNAYARLLFDSN